MCLPINVLTRLYPGQYCYISDDVFSDVFIVVAKIFTNKSEMAIPIDTT
jgi:hypothetical protein